MLTLTITTPVLMVSDCEKDNFDDSDLDEYLNTIPSIASQMPVEKSAELVGTADDHYDVETFEVPVSEIITSVIQGQNYNKTPLRVTDESDYIDFTYRFSYVMRRTSK